MKIYFQTFNNEKLLIQRFEGEWSTSIYKEYIIDKSQTVLQNNISKILTDLRNVNMPIVFKENNFIEELVNIRKLIPRTNFRNAQLVSQPISTVMAHLYQQDQAQLQPQYIYCSTLSYALNFLNLEISEDEMENMILNLSNKFTL